MIKLMDLELTDRRMDIFMRGTGLMMYRTVSERKAGLAEIAMWESTRMV